MKYKRTSNLLIALFIFAIISSQSMAVLGSTDGSIEIKLSETSALIPLRLQFKTADFDPLKGNPYIPNELLLTEQNGYYIIQCTGQIQPGWYRELESLGVTILDYVPDYAYAVHMDPALTYTIEQLPYVRWVGYFHPYYKISPDLWDRIGIVELNVIVFEHDNANRYIIMDALRSLNGHITYDGHDNSVVRVRIDSSKLNSIAWIPEVAWIDEYLPPVKVMDRIRQFTGAESLHFENFTGLGIVGEVKDNGIDQDHPDFVGQLIGTDGFPVEDAHGTSTFGIVFSSGANDPFAMGMMPEGKGVFADWYVSRIDSIENLVNDWNGSFQSNSWSQGFPNGWYSSFSRDSDNAIFNYDVTMLYAAGNEGGEKSMAQDAAAKNVIAVGGVNHYNDIDRTNDAHISGWSGNQGPAADGRIKPDLCGPYDEIYTTDMVGSAGYSSGNYYAHFGGTSGATPVVAGATGLVYQMYKEDFFGNNPDGELPHAATVKAILIANAYQYEFSQADRFEQGWGLVDVGQVYNNGLRHFIVNQEFSLETGDNVSFNISPLGTQPLKISLVWTDAPAAAWSNPALVNDLNLRVIGPNNTIYWGNEGLEDSKWSSMGGSPDNKNNVENVFIENTNSSDLWTVTVIAENIAKEGDLDTLELDQHFALVVTGGAIDEEPPVTTYTLDSVQGDNGWWTSDPVMVTLTPIDNISGVQYTRYTIDGSPWLNFTVPFPVTGEGLHTIEYYSVDYRNNIESVKSTEIKIDTVYPEYSSESPVITTTYDSYNDVIRLQVDWADATSGVSDSKFRYRFGSGNWTNWDNHTGSSIDTFWYDVTRNIWIEQVNETLYWESYGRDFAGLTEYSPTFNGTLIIDDDSNVPIFLNATSDGDIYDSYADSFRIQVDWIDESGIANAKFRFRNDTLPWSAWLNHSGFSDNTYWYDIPRGEWIDFVGSGIYWESMAIDSDNDRANDSLENYTMTQFGGAITDDDLNEPVYTPILHSDVYDNNYSDYRLQINWADESGFSQVQFRYRYDSQNWSAWENQSGLIDGTYWYLIPRTDWIAHVGSKIYWESRATDKDIDRIDDQLTDQTGTLEAGLIIDDDVAPPVFENRGDIYDIAHSSFIMFLNAHDASGWMLHVEYYYSSYPQVMHLMSNLTMDTNSVNLTVTIPESDLRLHESDTIYWRFILQDRDNDRTNDSLSTPWSAWITGFTIDLDPPVTEHILNGELGLNNWFISTVVISLTSEDEISGVDYINYRIDGSQWYEYVGSFVLEEAGIYVVDYYAVDYALNVEPMKTARIKIDSGQPVAVAWVEKESLAGSTVVLDGRGSEDNLVIVKYEWRIEKDGELVVTKNGAISAFRFDEVGEYEITLTVRDNGGNLDDVVVYLNIVSPKEEQIDYFWIILIIIIAVIAIISAIAILAVRRKRKKDKLSTG